MKFLLLFKKALFLSGLLLFNACGGGAGSSSNINTQTTSELPATFKRVLTTNPGVTHSNVGGYNDNGISALQMADDGFLYAYMATSGRWVIRIDPETGDVELFRVLTRSPSRFDIIGNDLYMGGSSLRKILDFKASYGF